MCGAARLFIFKNSTLFVFYGESIDSEGNPIFNYRSVKLPAEARCRAFTSGCSNGPATVGPDAVYYLSRDGVWATTGDVPFKVTDASVPDAALTPTPFGDFFDPVECFDSLSGFTTTRATCS